MLWNSNIVLIPICGFFLFGFCQGAGEGQEEDMKSILETLKRLDSYIRIQLNEMDNDLGDMWTNFDDLREKMDGLSNSQKALVEKVEESQMAVHGKVEEMDDKFTEKFGDLRETLDGLNDRDLQRDIWNNSCTADHITELQTNISTELQKIERSMEGCSSVEQQLSNLTMVNTKDVCAEGSHRCSPLAVCEDAIVSYRCICLPGYTGDGVTCEELPCVHPNFIIPGIKGCLSLTGERKIWLEASRHCSQQPGGRLLEGWDSNAQSELLSDYVYKALGGTHINVWVGSQDRRWREGKVDVPSVLFHHEDKTTYYLKHNPYGYLYTSYKRLFDDSGSSSYYFVCQRASPPPPSSSSSSSSSSST